MSENDNSNNTSEASIMMKYPDFIQQKSPMENVPGSEFILWGYKLIENEGQSRQPILMPIYRVIPSGCSNTLMPIILSTNDVSSLSIPTSLPSSLPSAASSAIPSSSSLTPSPIPVPTANLSQPPLISTAPSSSDHNDSENDQIQHLEPEKRSRQQYSPEVTKYLKQVFVDTIGQDRKLTKELRRKIMYETGLNSRSLTYWFSNRKRRPPFLAQQFKDSVKQSRGQVKTYEDFELWWALSKKNK